MKQRHRIVATPRARRRAKDKGIDLAAITGSGLGGRVLEADVLRSSAGLRLSPMRRAIARLTSQSFSTIPHFYLQTEIDASELHKFLEEARAKDGSDSVRPNLTDLLLRAQAQALAECPFMNVVWEDDSIRQLETIAIGLVVAVPGGIMVPVVEAPHVLALQELAAVRAACVEQCRAGKMSPDKCVGGGLTSPMSLSNLGRRRVDSFLPVIHLRQSSMLAVGNRALRPWVVDGELAVRPTLRFALAVDHRVIDGVQAAEYLDKLCSLAEYPLTSRGRDFQK